MPLHKRRAVFVKIDSGGCNGIFRVGAVREFTAALKNLTSTMYLHHCLQQQLDNFWVEIAANQHFGGGSDERHIIGRDVAVDIDHISWQYPIERDLGNIMVKASAIWKLMSRTLGFVSNEWTAVPSGAPKVHTASTLPSFSASTAAVAAKATASRFRNLRRPCQGFDRPQVECRFLLVLRRCVCF